MTISCPSRVILNESDDFSCLCKNEGGKNPVNVTWYKDNKRFRNTSNRKNLLNLTDVNENNNQTYMCVAQRYALKDEKSVDVIVYRKYML